MRTNGFTKPNIEPRRMFVSIFLAAVSSRDWKLSSCDIDAGVPSFA
jgi:hypothetical protein